MWSGQTNQWHQGPLSTAVGHLISKFTLKVIHIYYRFFSHGPYEVLFKRRDSPYEVHFKHRDSPYEVHFKRRDSPYV